MRTDLTARLSWINWANLGINPVFRRSFAAKLNRTNKMLLLKARSANSSSSTNPSTNKNEMAGQTQSYSATHAAARNEMATIKGTNNGNVMDQQQESGRMIMHRAEHYANSSIQESHIDDSYKPAHHHHQHNQQQQQQQHSVAHNHHVVIEENPLTTTAATTTTTSSQFNSVIDTTSSPILYYASNGCYEGTNGTKQILEVSGPMVTSAHQLIQPCADYSPQPPEASHYYALDDVQLGTRGREVGSQLTELGPPIIDHPSTVPVLSSYHAATTTTTRQTHTDWS